MTAELSLVLATAAFFITMLTLAMALPFYHYSKYDSERHA